MRALRQPQSGQAGSFKLLSTLLAVMLFISLAVPMNVFATSASNNKKIAAPRFIKIPVLYVTDRDQQGDTFGPNRKYIVHCLHDMYYGTVFTPVFNYKSKLPNETFQRLGWGSEEKVQGYICPKDFIKADEPELEKKLFFERLEKVLQQSGSNKLCVFLQGAADPFEDAAADAAELAYYMECPIILYSWPSVGKLKKYRVDEGNCEWSQEHFNTFCEDLEAFGTMHKIKATLVAHSVGNRLMARAVPVLRGSKVFHEAELVSPDIDAETFKHYVMDYHIRGGKVRLYFSNRDKVLSFTQMLYGGYYRLGEGVGTMLAMVSSPQDSLDQAAAQRQAAKLRSSRSRHFERIDYTAMDTKWVGHHFPYELVASMNATGLPPDGWVLVNEPVADEGNGNLFARYALWKGDLGRIGPLDATEADYCKLVVPMNKSEKFIDEQSNGEQ